MLAGGLGTRLRPVVTDVPKPMASVGGRPFLEIVLAWLVRSGVQRVVLSVGHLAHVIEEHFGARFRGVELAYAVEERPLGTGGGLRRSLARVEADCVLVANGDTWVDLDPHDLRRRHDAARRDDPGLRVTMAIHRVADAARYGRVTVEAGRIASFEPAGVEGPGWINAGVYWVDRSLLDDPALPERFSFEGDFLGPRLGEIRPLAYETAGRFIDIGVPEDYQRAQALLGPDAGEGP